MTREIKESAYVDESTIGVTSVFNGTGDHALLDHVATRDEEVLVALGYKQEFKRSVAIAFCLVLSPSADQRFKRLFHLELFQCVFQHPRTTSQCRLDPVV